MVAAKPALAEVTEWLEGIPDPEIPILSIKDLGILRSIEWDDASGELAVTITPTYCGCPAIEAIRETIRRSLFEHGIERFRIFTALSPPWTTDWLTDEAKERLRAYGVAPPPSRLIQLSAACPHCGSLKVELVSRFGSTPCKALYKCLDCLEPFDAFKQH